MAAARSGDLVESAHMSVKSDDTNTDSNNVKRENEENEKLHNESPQMLMSPRLKCSDESVKMQSESSRSIFKSPAVLRPSQLNGSVSPQKPAFLLNPSRLNPFTKIPSEANSAGTAASEGPQKSNFKSDRNGNAPQFLPLIQNGGKSESAITIASSATSRSNDFVFGQNIQDRVVSDNKSEDAKSAGCANENGTSAMLFSSALKESPITDSSSTTQAPKSLSESAREYEESRASKRKYEEVEVKTGEEGETNVLQITCKLFAFDKTGGGTWQERGRGLLRLNDQEGEDAISSNSRLVFRTSGSLRVVLNTKIWAEMTIQRASDKSIRLTAIDSSGEIKVYLVTGNPEDVKHLQKHLEVRVAKEMEKHKSSSASSLSCLSVTSLESDSKKLAINEQPNTASSSN